MKVKIGNKKYEFFGKSRGSNSNKFNRVAKLATMFEDIDYKMSGMLKRGNYTTDTARCALAVKLLMYTGVRVGNETSAEGYMTKPHPFSKAEPKFVKTFGLTTLKHEHVEVKSDKAKLFFVGKKQVDNYYEVKDKEVVKALKTLTKQEMDTLLGVSHYQLTKFIKRYVGNQFSPKDFRTLRANMYAYEVASSIAWEELTRKSDVKKQVRHVCEKVAEKLCNTPTVCKKSYIDDNLFGHVAGI